MRFSADGLLFILIVKKQVKDKELARAYIPSSCLFNFVKPESCYYNTFKSVTGVKL